jgi:hypothetical protein
MFTAKIAHTPDERRQCYRLRAAEYRRYYHNVPHDEFRDEFDDLQLPDGNPQARSILTQTNGLVVGTMRLLVVSDVRYPGLQSEIASFMDFDIEQWKLDALAREASHGASHSVAEIGKLAVARDKDTKPALGTTLAGLGQIAVRLGISVVLAAMVPAVERRLRCVGLKFRHLTEARLRRDSRHQINYLLKYHQYFLPMLKRRLIDIDPIELSESDASCEVLQAFISDCGDGPSLYWMTTEEFVDSTRDYHVPLSCDERLLRFDSPAPRTTEEPIESPGKAFPGL